MAETFIIFKPDTFKRNLENTLIHEIESHGFKISDKKEVIVDENTILKHYEEVIQRVPNPDFKNYILNAFVGKKVWIMKLRSDSDHTVEDFRVFLGKTNPVDADKNSLRGKYGDDSYERSTAEKRMLNNLIHASDSIENAQKELNLWYKNKVN